LILEVTDLKKSFGGITAVNRISFGMAQGEVSSIIGPNGAGKTTLFNLITGKIRPDGGQVKFKNEDISGILPHRLSEKKIGRSFQITNIFPKLTVFDNIKVAILASLGKSRMLFSNAGGMANGPTEEILAGLGMTDKKEVLGGLLAHGDQKRLDIGIAIASRPEILFLDEPTAGMSPEETIKTTELLQKLAKERGLTLLLIEHDMSVVFKISERIRVMHQGNLIAEGTPEEIRRNGEVQRIYLGEQI
jgi:branched-chain amino acid transport system ATP-binding protein